MPGFEEWESFYVIVGAAAGALIGLQFVVMTLLADRPVSAAASAAFSTPQIVHFSAVLLLTALLRAPWHGIGPAAVLWGIVGLAGIIYEIMVVRMMRGQTVYRPAFEDWLFHVTLPFAAYALLAASAIAAFYRPTEAQFAVGAAALVLLFAGIHNAWDAVTYHMTVRRREPPPEKKPQAKTTEEKPT
jgi:hypothetical protein